MSEREYSVFAYGVEYRCDECGKGNMEYDKSSMAPYCMRHICTNCGVVDYLEEKYPTVRFRRIPNGPIVSQGL